ncbi:MAG: riboflavin biosynthesis protein RibF [Oscillospiraceae bacterium]|nr:riboflavin biosynthesis protein RibF [Oscillospiraceae bacterium]
MVNTHASGVPSGDCLMVVHYILKRTGLFIGHKNEAFSLKVFDRIQSVDRPPASVSVALGLFDGLHLGHMGVIARARQAAEDRRLALGVFTFTMNGAVPPHKQPGEIISFNMFSDIMRDMGVDYIFRPDFSQFHDIPAVDFINTVLLGRFGAAHISCGENFRFGRGGGGGTGTLIELCRGRAGVDIVPMLSVDGAPVSSSRIRARIQAGDIPAANALLGRRFCIDFEVVHGRALARSWGSPTINQPFPDTFVTPRFGVYATVSRIANTWYSSVTNVGVKPTVGSDHVLAETYIHDFEGDLYGRKVRVDFLDFIRPERKFDDLETLRAQINADSAAAADIAGAYVVKANGSQ